MSGKNCTTCANREKHIGMDTENGDFWRCTATPAIPAFTGDALRRFDPPLVNLRSFDEDHPSAEYQNRKTCPLQTPTAANQGKDG